MKVFVCTEAGGPVGYGHLNRCTALSLEIKEHFPQSELLFFVNEDAITFVEKHGFQAFPVHRPGTVAAQYHSQKADWIIFDSYRAKQSDLNALKRVGKILSFDDNNLYPEFSPDILLNGNLYAENLDYRQNSRILAGPQYMILNRAYRQASKPPEKQNVLITTGGSDTYRLLPKFIEALSQIQKTIVVGPGISKPDRTQLMNMENEHTCLLDQPKGLRSAIETSDIVISSGGSTVYEILCMQRIPIVFYTAENQIRTVRAIKKAGGTSLGSWQQIQWQNLSQIIIKLRQSNNMLDNSFKALYNRVDGNGAKRIVLEIKKESA